MKERGNTIEKEIKLITMFIFIVGMLLGCSISTEPITAETASGLWNKVFVLPLASFITLLYNLLNHNLRFAIILATAIVRGVLMPLYAKSNKSTTIMQEIQPEIKKLQKNMKIKKFKLLK